MAQVSAVTEKYSRKQANIINAAILVFTKRSVGNARLSDVGDAVGLKTTSITYYFKRKEDLAAACYLQTIGEFRAIAQLALATADPHRDSVRCLLDLYFDMLAAIRREERSALMPFDEILSLRGDNANEVFAAFVEMYRDIRRVLLSAIGTQYSAADADARAHLLLSQLLWVPAWLDDYQAAEFPRLAEQWYDMFACGLAASPLQWRVRETPRYEAPTDARKVFLKAAIEAINAAGYPGASVDRIAARLNLTKGSFYHHYDTKEELGLACFQHSIDVMERALEETPEQDDSCQRLQQVLCNLTSFQLDDAGPLVTSGAIRTLSPELRQQVLTRHKHFSSRLADIVARGVEEGSLRPVDPQLAAQIMTRSIIAAHELPRWVRGVDRLSALDLYVKPIFLGAL